MAARKLFAFAALQLLLIAATVFGVHWSERAASPAANVPAHGDWTKVTDNNLMSFYLSPTRSEGPIQQVWQLIDIKDATESEASVLGMVEYDCRAQKYRILFATGFSGRMGSGRVLWKKTKPDDWNDPPRGVTSFFCASVHREWV